MNLWWEFGTCFPIVQVLEWSTAQSIPSKYLIYTLGRGVLSLQCLAAPVKLMVCTDTAVKDELKEAETHGPPSQPQSGWRHLSLGCDLQRVHGWFVRTWSQAVTRHLPTQISKLALVSYFHVIWRGRNKNPEYSSFSSQVLLWTPSLLQTY